MKLRSILVILSLLAFLSASVGGFLYYATLKDSTFKEAKRQAATRAEMIRKNLSSFLSENIRPAKTLAGMPACQNALVQTTPLSLIPANDVLDHFKATLDVDVCYLMDAYGTTVASSNRNDPDSFVGKNFSFRPYFQEAIEGTPSSYLALGTTSHKRGVYYSHPVYEQGRGGPIGVVVIKASIELIEKELPPGPDEIVLVSDPKGVVFISNRKDWLFRSVEKLSIEDMFQIRSSQQFGTGPWTWTGMSFENDERATDLMKNEYLVHRMGLYHHYPGWRVTHLYSLKAISKMVSDPLIRIIRPIIVLLCLFLGVSVFLLYRKASDEIAKRKNFESALAESERRYRSIYHNTPAMLHSIDAESRLIHVSDNWLEVLGYRRDEVIGQKLTRYFTAASKRFAEETVFPEFFKTGICKDVPYQYLKRDGQTVDVLLSAIGDRDSTGRVFRSLAVSIDVTERNRAERALKMAKEALSRYSKDLEVQVEERTREITRILNQLRRLSGSIMVNQEKERAAIARELHDELGQVLTALRLDLVWLSARLREIDPKASRQALTMCDLIDKSINDVRGIAIRLRPNVLDDLGLVDALEWYTSDFERRSGIRCSFEPKEVPFIDDTVATAAYRIIQEALTNVARHALASHVEIVLEIQDHTLILAVIDNGNGFNLEDLSETEALGIAGMRERAGLVGGILEVSSRPQKGTGVYFRVPLHEPKEISS